MYFQELSKCVLSIDTTVSVHLCHFLRRRLPRGWQGVRASCSSHYYQNAISGMHFQTGKIMPLSLPFSCAILTADSTTGTPAISTTTTVEIRKSSVMTTEVTSKVEKSPGPASGRSSCPSAETEEEKAKRLLYCSLCKVAVNSASQLEAHNSGEMQPSPPSQQLCS